MNRRVLCTALGALFSTTCSAVEWNPDGLGQALIYPYYTVRNGGDDNAWNTYISVVNSTSSAKAVRVHVREGRHGRSALDFNLYLAPNGVWTGAFIPRSGSADAPAGLITADHSCTDPVIGPEGVTLSNAAFSGSLDDGYGIGLDRTREGYVEMLEMATLTGPSALSVTPDSTLLKIAS